MKNLDLSTYGVEEMNEMQMQEVDGGIIQLLPFVASALIGGFIYDVVSNPSDAASAFNEGIEARWQMSSKVRS